MPNKIFHVHTWRCRHMNDDEKEEAYIKKAIELGVDSIWFTDHAPFVFDPFRFRMGFAQFPEYLSTLMILRKQYEGMIEIKIGLEIEYLSNFHSYYESLRETGGFDVLLLGQHFSWLPKEGIYTFESREKIREARPLADGMIAGMETGLFEVVAHPDQIFRRCKTFGAEEEQIAREIKECAVKNGVILEKNISNMLEKKKRRVYRPEFWEDLPEGLRTIYGVDAHSIEEMETNYRFMVNLLEKESLKIEC